MKPPTLQEYKAWERDATRPYTQDPIGEHNTKRAESALRSELVTATPRPTSKERNRAWRARKKAA